MNLADPHPRRGFTLLELIAVVAIIGLMASLVYPNLGGLGEQSLRDQARRLVAELELARERTVATGLRHRMVLDLEAGTYWTEQEIWQPEPGLEHLSLSDGPRPIRLPASLRRPWIAEKAPWLEDVFEDSQPLEADSAILMQAPTRVARSFEPCRDRSGRPRLLDDELVFEGVELEASFVDRGVFWLPFELDGSTDAARIRLGRADGRSLALEVRPLADTVRIVDEDA